ncbi:uncharacterized protein FYW61_004153 [Anableps anableps]
MISVSVLEHILQICHNIMSDIRQIAFTHHSILNQQDISVLDQRETESLKTKGKADKPELTQVKEDEYKSEYLQFIKKEDHIVLKQEADTLVETDSLFLEIKEEPMKLELKQMEEDDHQSESQQVVKIEVEDIGQDVLKQESSTLMGTDCGPLEIKEEPLELDPKQLKEEEHGSGPQQIVKTSAHYENEDELKITRALILKASDDETDYPQPELSSNKIFFQNFSGQHQEIKTQEVSGSSRDEQQKRAQEIRAQSDTVKKGMKGKEIHKARKCKECKVCGKRFKFSSSLIIHENSHRREPFLMFNMW